MASYPQLNAWAPPAQIKIRSAAPPTSPSVHLTMFHTDHIRGPLLVAAAMLLHIPGSAHDGEHAEDGSYFSYPPYEEACPDHLVLFREILVHQDAKAILRRMWKDAAIEDVRLVLHSGFRDAEYQAGLFYRDASERPLTEIARSIAPPGHSEHHTGLAFDFDDGDDLTYLKQRFEHTRAGKWLLENAHRYGLHLSFPRNNSQGTIYEPWHYFMKDLSAAVRRRFRHLTPYQ